MDFSKEKHKMNMFLHFYFVTLAIKAVEMQAMKNAQQKCHKILIYCPIFKI